ncbi:DNA translocase FtsK [bacterium]|nr:DNA translocase FtsK [bacterium]MBU1651438.1 DNA translocase FtsK [bacterium]MBU1881669.1 DNA translocase FtsK [bacterium]
MKRTSTRRQRRKPNTSQGRLSEILGILLLTLAVLIFLALISFPGELNNEDSSRNIIGKLGAELSGSLTQFFFGRWPAFVFPGLLILWSLTVFFKWPKLRSLYISLGVLGLAFWIAFTVSLVGMPDPNSEHAGLIGVEFGTLVVGFMGLVGAWILWSLVVIVAAILLLQIRPSEILKGIGFAFKSVVLWIWDKRPRRLPKFSSFKRKPKPTAESTDFSGFSDNLPPEPFNPGAPQSEDLFQITKREMPTISTAVTEKPDGTKSAEYQLPPLTLLADPPPESPDAPEELKEKANRLQAALADFGVGAKVVRINPGPVITRFDLEPDPGVKVSRISNLADDLALVLRARAIRIQAPIPGQGAVGVEIPNKKPSVVVLKSIAADPLFAESDAPLVLALGSMASGKPYVSDLAKMPHLLVAGTTGSGKSVCLNAIIASLLLNNPPQRLQFVIIDPKKLELSIYARLARHHLLTSDDLDEEVITTAPNAVRALGGVELEMGRRYDMLAGVGVRGIDEFNRLAEKGKAVSPEGEVLKPLSFLVVVVDELADLMMISGKDIEEPIARLAQMARAVGIHLIVATQRPSVDVITGVIKANFPARLAFQVASKIDSRTILDVNGADTLLGNGDALFIPPGRGTPERIHCCYVSPEEIEDIISHIEDQPHDFYRHPLRLPHLEGISSFGGNGLEDRDELFEEAARMVIRQGQASVSILQRRLKIGYARAGRLVDQLERAGIVGPFDGSKAREVLVDEDYLQFLDGDAPPP